MAHQQLGVILDRDQFCCSICLDLLKEPVTLPCGHNYCRRCIEGYWDQNRDYSCPECRESFSPRPVLKKNNMMAEIVEKVWNPEGRNCSPSATPVHAAPVHADPADVVVCDFCTGTTCHEALMSCLVCQVSFCETHLQPHYNVPALKKHKLVPATARLQEKMCSNHDRLMEVYCRTDQQCICYLCIMDEHKGHNTVSAAAERTEKQKQLVLSQQNIHLNIQERKKDLIDLRQAIDILKFSASGAVEASDKIFSKMIVSIETRRSEVKQLILDQEKTEVAQAEGLLRQLEEEIAKLERKHADLEELSNTDDTIHFIQNYQSLNISSEAPVLLSIVVLPLRSFADVSDAVSDLGDKLEIILKTTWPEISERVFGTSTSSEGPFGSTNTTSSSEGLFGKTNNPSSSEGLFGKTNNPSSRGHPLGKTTYTYSRGHPFGKTTNTSSRGHPFGKTTNTSSRGHQFGKTNNPSSRAHPFGNTNNTSSCEGLFGNTTTSSSCGHPFGNTNTASSSGYPFGNTTTSSSSEFCLESLLGNTTTASSSGHPFGNTTTSSSSEVYLESLFGNTNTTARHGRLFGNTNTTARRGGLFGNTNTTTRRGGLFGNTNTTTRRGGLFGNTNTTTSSGGLFGNTNTTTRRGGQFGKDQHHL